MVAVSCVFAQSGVVFSATAAALLWICTLLLRASVFQAFPQVTASTVNLSCLSKAVTEISDRCTTPPATPPTPESPATSQLQNTMHASGLTMKASLIRPDAINLQNKLLRPCLNRVMYAEWPSRNELLYRWESGTLGRPGCIVTSFINMAERTSKLFVLVIKYKKTKPKHEIKITYDVWTPCIEMNRWVSECVWDNLKCCDSEERREGEWKPPKRARAYVWQHLDLIMPKKVTRLICAQELAFNNNPSSMPRHLSSKRPDAPSPAALRVCLEKDSPVLKCKI